MLGLAHCKVETTVSASRDFTLLFDAGDIQDHHQARQPSGRLKKVFFQAKDPREREAWVNALQSAIDKAGMSHSAGENRLKQAYTY